MGACHGIATATMLRRPVDVVDLGLHAADVNFDGIEALL
jgi:hypothetical protein